MRKMKTLPLPRYVLPESIDEGDTIRVTWIVGDLEHTRMGKVGRIHTDTGSRIKSFVTVQGNEICRHDPNNGRARFTLLAEADKPQEALFEVEAVNA